MGRRDLFDPRMHTGARGLGAFYPDTCTITRPGKGPLNPATGTHPPTTTATPYTGRCAVTAWPDMGRRVVAREDVVIQGTYWVNLPPAATGIAKNDVVTIDASEDPELAGRRLVVREVVRGTHPSGRQLICQEVT